MFNLPIFVFFMCQLVMGMDGHVDQPERRNFVFTSGFSGNPADVPPILPAGLPALDEYGCAHIYVWPNDHKDTVPPTEEECDNLGLGREVHIKLIKVPFSGTFRLSGSSTVVEAFSAHGIPIELMAGPNYKADTADPAKTYLEMKLISISLPGQEVELESLSRATLHITGYMLNAAEVLKLGEGNYIPDTSTAQNYHVFLLLDRSRWCWLCQFEYEKGGWQTN